MKTWSEKQKQKDIIKESCLNWLDQLMFVVMTWVPISDTAREIDCLLENTTRMNSHLSGHTVLIFWEISKYPLSSQYTLAMVLPTPFFPEATCLLLEGSRGLRALLSVLTCIFSALVQGWLGPESRWERTLFFCLLCSVLFLVFNLSETIFLRVHQCPSLPDNWPELSSEMVYLLSQACSTEVYTEWDNRCKEATILSPLTAASGWPYAIRQQVLHPARVQQLREVSLDLYRKFCSIGIALRKLSCGYTDLPALPRPEGLQCSFL